MDLSVSAFLDDLAERLGPLFHVRKRAIAPHPLGLLSQCERKNGWHLAEWLEDATSDGVQYLLGRARWNAEAGSEVKMLAGGERKSGGAGITDSRSC